MSIPKWSVRNPTLVIMLTLFVFIIGLINLFTMSRREQPEIAVPVAVVLTVFPGAGADQVEEQVTKK